MEKGTEGPSAFGLGDGHVIDPGEATHTEIGDTPAQIEILLTLTEFFSTSIRRHNHGCRQEQEIVQGQEGLEEAHRPVSEDDSLHHSTYMAHQYTGHPRAYQSTST